MESLADQSGLDDSLFLSAVPEYLRCIVCSLVLRDPVQIICCGHKHCKVCFEQMKAQAQNTGTELLCPVDREVVDMDDVRPDVAMKRIIGSLQVKCHEHENGCDWTGDLSELGAHHDKCELRKPETSTFITEDLLKKMNKRVEQCEASLFDKDKEIASLKYSLRLQEQQQQELTQQQQEQQQQLKEEVALLKHNSQLQEQEQQEQKQQLQQQQQQQQQLKDEMELLKQKNEILVGEISHLKEERGQQQQKNKLLEQEIKEHKYVNMTTLEMGVQSRSHGTSVKQVVAQKTIPVEHHNGDRQSVTVSEDFHTVVFHDLSIVSAPTAVIPRGTRVWYEVHFLPGVDFSWSQIGLATDSLPTSEELTGEGVGDTKSSYGFNPFSGIKYHGGSAKWGNSFERNDGGYVGVAVDMDEGKIFFSVNGDWNRQSGAAFSPFYTGTPLFPALSGSHITLEVNFGDRDFKYGPPALNFISVIDSLS